MFLKPVGIIVWPLLMRRLRYSFQVWILTLNLINLEQFKKCHTLNGTLRIDFFLLEERHG